MREKVVEQKLTMEVKKRDGICPKFTSPGFDGMPDRLVLLPDGKIGFVEVKIPGENPRHLQLRRMKQLQQLGFCCYVIDNKEMIEGVLDEIQTS